LITAITIAKIAAAQKPEVLKLVIILSTNKIISTVIIKEKRPRVMMLKGKVSILRINPMVALARAINTAAKIALPNPLTSTPGVMYDPKSMTRPINNISRIKLIMFNLV
jgi:hypothetical protein